MVATLYRTHIMAFMKDRKYCLYYVTDNWVISQADDPTVLHLGGGGLFGRMTLTHLHLPHTI